MAAKAIGKAVHVRGYMRNGKHVKGYTRTSGRFARVRAGKVRSGTILHYAKPSKTFYGSMTDVLHVGHVRHGKHTSRLSGHASPATARGYDFSLRFPRGTLFWHDPGYRTKYRVKYGKR